MEFPGLPDCLTGRTCKTFPSGGTISSPGRPGRAIPARTPDPAKELAMIQEKPATRAGAPGRQDPGARRPRRRIRYPACRTS